MTVILIILTVIVFIMLLILFLIFPGHGANEHRAEFMHVNLAHRGLHTKDKKIPENSIPAFKAAVSAGYGIELDIQLTKDFKVVVFHDDTLDRVCGIEGRVDEYTYSELKAFRLCGTDETIPLFTEVLGVIGGKVPLLVELKNGQDNDRLCKKCLDLMRQYKGIYCIESFSPFIVRWFKRNAPDILRGQLSASAKEFAGTLPGYQAVALGHLFTNVFARPHFVSYHKNKKSILVKLCDRLGAMRFVWTIRAKDDIAFYESINDAVIFEFYRPQTKA